MVTERGSGGLSRMAGFAPPTSAEELIHVAAGSQFASDELNRRVPVDVPGDIFLSLGDAMVTTVEPTNVEVAQSRFRRNLRSWRFWVGAVVVAGLVAGWGLNFYNYALSEENAASVATLVKDKDSLTEQLEAA